MSSTIPARGIGALDRLAEQFADAAPARLAVADSPAELIAAHRLRHRYAAEDEDDTYDLRALQICAWQDELLVGTARLVLPVPGKRLPTEAAFDLVVQPAGEVVDIGRARVATSLGADAARGVWYGLFAQAWFETRARGYMVMTGAATAQRLERFRALGVEFEVLGPARSFPEGELQPVRLDPALGGDEH